MTITELKAAAEEAGLTTYWCDCVLYITSDGQVIASVERDFEFRVRRTHADKLPAILRILAGGTPAVLHDAGAMKPKSMEDETT